MPHPRCLAGALLALALSAAPALAIEQWGRVETTNARYQRFSIRQEGSGREYTIRFGPDTILVPPDGRPVPARDVRQIAGRRVYCLVEENPEHYAMKIWIRPEVPPERDPINPGVGATPLRPRTRRGEPPARD